MLLYELHHEVNISSFCLVRITHPPMSHTHIKNNDISGGMGMKKIYASSKEQPTIFIQQPYINYAKIQTQQIFRSPIIKIDLQDIEQKKKDSSNSLAEHNLKDRKGNNQERNKTFKKQSRSFINSTLKDLVDKPSIAHQTKKEIQEEQNMKQLEFPDVEEDMEKLKSFIRRLALYPDVISRPVCSAIVEGKKINFHIISKRGDLVRIKYNNRVKDVKIDDIKDFTIISK